MLGHLGGLLVVSYLFVRVPAWIVGSALLYTIIALVVHFGGGLGVVA